MKKNAVSLYPLIAALILFLSLLTPAYARYGGGTGDPNTPYKISDFNDLMALRADSNDWNRCFILTADIDLDPNLPGRMVFTNALISPNSSGSSFHGIPFTGVFDGNNLKIKNLKIDTGSLIIRYLGFFGQIGSGGLVKNLAIEDCLITTGDNSLSLGGLCGDNGGTISNCSASGSVSCGNDSWELGGLCGSSNGTISNCLATASLSGTRVLGGLCGGNRGTIINCRAIGNVYSGYDLGYVGGLCGYNDGAITNCYATGSFNGDDFSWFLGGLCGYNYSGSISNCYATGNVTGRSSSQYLGGLCGYNYEGTISKCYAAVTVIGGNGSYDLGGLCGYNSSGMISNCFWDMQTSGMAVGVGSGSSEGVYGCTTEQIQQQVTFTDYGWDFVNFWDICEGTNYPKLLWSIPQGDMLCPDGVNFTDYAYFTDIWNSNDPNADFDLSGLVDTNDFVIFSNDWLKGF